MTSISVSRAMAGSSGSGAGHLIRSTFAVQPYTKDRQYIISKLIYRIGIRENHAYRRGRILDVETDVFGLLRPHFLGLEEQLPNVFVHRAKEVLQGLWPLWTKLPHVRGPELAWESPAEERHLNHVCETDVFSYHVGDALLQHLHIRHGLSVKALSGPGGEPGEGSGSEIGCG